MTAMNDDKPRPAATIKAKAAAKSTKGQRTLFDMFSKKVDTECPEILPVSFSTQPEVPSTGPNDTEGMDVVSSPVTTANPLPEPSTHLVTEHTPAEPRALQDRSHHKPTLADGSVRFDGTLLAPSRSQTSSQGSKDEPIVLDSSPIRPTAQPNHSEGESFFLPRSKKPLHPFFIPRNKPQNSNAAKTTATSRKQHTKDLDPPYPDQESQHVKGNQSLYPPIPCPFERRATLTVPDSGPCGPLGDDDNDYATSLSFLIPCEQFEQPQNVDEAIPPVAEPKDSDWPINQSRLSEHPAIARVAGATASSSPSMTQTQLWTEAWRPRQAKEVLGNEQSAIYLRNWLHTLALQLYPAPQEDEPKKRKRKNKNKKRPRVVREVPRKKPRRDGLGDWIVGDDEEDDDDMYVTASQDFDSFQYSEFGEGEEGLLLSATHATDIPETVNEPLHNTILLCGPPGSGKTAAVYACAEELGWEVFEVYPGIGRRNGANVDNLVGDVGKNHLVRKNKGSTGQQPSIATLLSSNAGDVEGGGSGGGGGSHSADMSAGASLEHHDDMAGGQADETVESFRQSVILLEEVDLLFKDDVNFWPAVTNLIKECRRPVICTCNDASLVPKDELPLQKVLYFEPCGPDIAIPYLHGLARAEGHILSPEWVRGLYFDTHRLAGAEAPRDASPTTAHTELPDFDLRRAIHSLQMQCTTSGGGGIEDRSSVDWETSTDILDGLFERWAWECDYAHGDQVLPVPDAGEEDKRERNIAEWEGVSGESDLLSYLDSSVMLPVTGWREGLGYGRMEGSPDDENGHGIVYRGSLWDRYEIGGRGVGDLDGEIGLTAIRLARGRMARGMARGRTLIDGDGGHLRWGLFRRRVEYSKGIGGIAWQSGGIGIGASWEAVYTEYVPYIQEMARQVEALGSPSGRVTRNSQRSRMWECVSLLGRTMRAALAGAWLTDGQRVMGATWGGRAVD